jgi:uncharacterized phage-associated protein
MDTNMFKKNISIRQIIQALYYIQSGAPAVNDSKNDIMYLLKIFYFSERYHLRHYGITATNDSFIAMKNGPVASAAKDILEGKLPYYANSAESTLLSDVEVISEYGRLIKPQQQDELSPSFIKALNFALNNFGRYTQFNLSKISHCYPEWFKFKDELDNGNIKSASMDLLDFFDNPRSIDIIKQDPFADDRDFLASLKQDYLENAISC